MPDLKLVQDNTSTGSWTHISPDPSSDANSDSENPIIRHWRGARERLEKLGIDPEAVLAERAVDAAKAPDHTLRMTDITRDELNKTLSGIEHRMDKRIDRMEQSEDRRADAYRREQEARDRLYAERSEATNRRLEDRDKIIDSKLDAMNTSIMSTAAKVGEFESKLSSNLAGVKDSNRSTALFIIGTLIASVLAFLAINATMIYGAKSFFDSGKEIAALQSSIEDLKKSISPPKLEPTPAPAPAPAK